MLIATDLGDHKRTLPAQLGQIKIFWLRIWVVQGPVSSNLWCWCLLKRPLQPSSGCDWWATTLNWGVAISRPGCKELLSATEKWLWRPEILNSLLKDEEACGHRYYRLRKGVHFWSPIAVLPWPSDSYLQGSVTVTVFNISIGGNVTRPWGSGRSSQNISSSVLAA